MQTIIVESNPSDERLAQLGVVDWPIWEKEKSFFPWHYQDKETAYILQGEVIVTPDDGRNPVHLRVGDLVVFPADMSCTWEIRQDLRKHYQFG